jgi:hypothetical protein
MVGKARITVNFEGRKYGGRGSGLDAVEGAPHAYVRAVAAYLFDKVPKRDWPSTSRDRRTP